MQLNDVPAVWLVGSGKGGVGKTTVSSDLARIARDMDIRVGLIDADISTPNSPEVVGAEGQDLSEQRLSTSEALVPPEVDGIQLISKGMVLPDDVPVLRDAEWRMQTVADYIMNAEWDDETDLVIIDSPPGTGGEIQMVMDSAAPDFGVVVTTPHPSALRDARKTHEFFAQHDLAHGAVLNMAYIPGDGVAEFVAANTEMTDIQGIGDAKRDDLADQMREDTEPFPLFGYDPDSTPEFPVNFEATVPYSGVVERRTETLVPLLRNRVLAPEVEA